MAASTGDQSTPNRQSWYAGEVRGKCNRILIYRLGEREKESQFIIVNCLKDVKTWRGLRSGR